MTNREGARSGPTILLVDDNRTNRLVVRAYLVGQGYEFIDTSDGADALTKIRETVPDLVISDIFMPALDGWELVKALRSDRRPEVRKIPIILASAKHDADVERRSKEAGADAFIKKPIVWQDLAKLVRELLGR
ncbi:MAG: response regulator [Polyangiaceae bacterium]|nr:response regulator [Polyangiaceae bacterium]